MHGFGGIFLSLAIAGPSPPALLHGGCSAPVRRKPHPRPIAQPALSKVGLTPSRGSTFPVLILNIHLLSPGLTYGELNPVRVETPSLFSSRLCSTWELS